MNFIDHLVIDNEGIIDTTTLNKEIGFRHCRWLTITQEMHLSVQASSMHYCCPRAMLPIDEYTCFEVALILDGSLSYDLSKLEDFPKHDELLYCWQNGVFANVPKDLVNDLYNWLMVQYGCEIIDKYIDTQKGE